MVTKNQFYDDEAVAVVNTLRDAIRALRLHGEDRAQFNALLNAIEVQVEARRADSTVLGYLCEALGALADARGVDRNKVKLNQRVDALQHIIHGA